MAEFDLIQKGEPDWHNKLNAILQALNINYQRGISSVDTPANGTIVHSVTFPKEFTGYPYVLYSIINGNSSYLLWDHALKSYGPTKVEFLIKNLQDSNTQCRILWYAFE